MRVVSILLLATSLVVFLIGVRGKEQHGEARETTRRLAMKSNETVIWASNGGGWRSMAIMMGFANMFYKAGLITETDSTFASISTNSAASWFNTQFFYSQIFFDKTVSEDPEDLYKFVVQWMESYKKLFGIRSHGIRGCGPLSVFLGRGARVPLIFNCMFRIATRDYGDPDLPTRVLGVENRVPALRRTDMNVQLALSPTTRTLSRPQGEYAVTYLGPSNTREEKIFATNLQCHYSVRNNTADFFFGVERENLPIRTYIGKTNTVFNINDWKAFHLYPPESNATVYTSSFPKHIYDRGFLNEPFQGAPRMNQISIASGIVTDERSGSSPAYFAQGYSTSLYKIEQERRNIIDETFRKLFWTIENTVLYSTDIVGTEFGMCGQWPELCKPNDVVFGDGGASDGSSILLTVGRHHTEDNADLSKPLKIIKCFTYFESDKDTKFLAYFNTTFNQGVEPGDFLWAPSTIAERNVQPNPWRSPQMFEEYLDQDSLDSIRGGFLPGVNCSASELTATTIENKAAGVKAGQKVKFLLLTFRGSVPTFIFSATGIEKWKDLIGESARSVARSKELLDRVQQFVNS